MRSTKLSPIPPQHTEAAPSRQNGIVRRRPFWVRLSPLNAGPSMSPLGLGRAKTL